MFYIVEEPWVASPKASAEVADLAKDLNTTASGTDLKNLKGEVNDIKNTTARNSDVTTIKTEQFLTLGGLALTTVVLVAGFGALHTQNRRKIKEQNELLWNAIGEGKIKKPKEIPKGEAKRVSKEDKF